MAVLPQHPDMVQGLLNKWDIASGKKSSTVTVLITRVCGHINNYSGEIGTPPSRMTDDSSHGMTREDAGLARIERTQGLVPNLAPAPAPAHTVLRFQCLALVRSHVRTNDGPATASRRTPS